jgi:hypothetical protein
MANMMYSGFSFGDNYTKTTDGVPGDTSHINDDPDAFLKNDTNLNSDSVKTDSENYIHGIHNTTDDLEYKNEINYSEYHGEEDSAVYYDVDDEAVEEEAVDDEAVEEEEVIEEKEALEEDEEDSEEDVEEEDEYTSEEEEDDEKDLDYEYDDPDDKEDKKYEYCYTTKKKIHNTRLSTSNKLEAMNARKEKACLKRVIRETPRPVKRRKTFKNEWTRRLRSQVKC